MKTRHPVFFGIRLVSGGEAPQFEAERFSREALLEDDRMRRARAIRASSLMPCLTRLLLMTCVAVAPGLLLAVCVDDFGLPEVALAAFGFLSAFGGLSLTFVAADTDREMSRLVRRDRIRRAD